MPAQDLSITALWQINQYTMTFNTGGGNLVNPMTQDFETAIDHIATPEKEGYTFIGWYPEIPETMPAQDISITALWQINQFTMTFDTDGGSEIDSITIDFNAAITLDFENPTKEGFEFTGWYPEIPETMPAHNMTVKAQWQGQNLKSIVESNNLEQRFNLYNFMFTEDELIIENMVEFDGVNSFAVIEDLSLFAIEFDTVENLDFLISVLSVERYEGAVFERDERYPLILFFGTKEIFLEETIIIENAIKSLDGKHLYYVFYSQNNIVNVPEGIQNIKLIIMQGYSDLTFHIPNSVSNVQMGYHRISGFVVAEDNPYLTSHQGSLYNKDKTILIRHKSTYYESVEILDSVLHIAEFAFLNNYISSVTIHENVISIGKGSFQESHIENITIEGDENRFNDQWEYIGFPLILKPSIIFYEGLYFDPETNTIIDYDSSYGLDVVIPATIDGYDVLVIGSRAFRFAYISSISLPNTLTDIGQYAFYYNYLTSVTIPSSVVNIGVDAFFANRIESIIIEGDENRFNHLWDFIGFPARLKASIIKHEGFYFDPETNTIVDYDSSYGLDVVIPATIDGYDVLVIGSRAFYYRNLETLVIEEGIIRIGQSAFSENQLQSITIPSTVIHIGYYAFGYNNIENITIEGDENRFNDYWINIGFPLMLKPSVVKYQGFYFDKDNQTIFAYDSSYGLDVIIPETIEGFDVLVIGTEAFYSLGITSVTIPSTVIEILDFAFWYNSITHIVIPEGVVKIAYSAFRSNHLISVTISSTVIEIGNSAFRNNPIEEVIIRGDENRFNDVWSYIGFDNFLKPTVIFDEGFYFDKETNTILGYDSSYDLEVVIPEMIEGIEVLIIADYALAGLGLTSLTLPESLTTIQRYAFAFNSIEVVVIPANVTNIGNEAFAGNPLISVVVEGNENRFNEGWSYIGFPILLKPGVFEYEGFLFDSETQTILLYDTNYGYDVVIPETIEGYDVLHIGRQVFRHIGISSLVIPNSILTIGTEAFMGNQLLEVIIPEGVIEIYDRAFSDNYSIQHVTISSTVEEIGWNAFSGLYNIQSVTINGDENRFNEIWQSIGFPSILKPSMIQYEGFLFDSDYGIILAYDESYGLDIIIPETIEGFEVISIGNWAFAYKDLTSVTLPEGLLYIQSDAFEGNQISEIVIPNTVLTIGSWAFAYNQLASLVIPSGLTEISRHAFRSNNLTSITIEGDENRFNEMWESIGFPTMLRPGIILFEGFVFDKDRNIILAYDESYGLDIIIPETIEGFEVISIGNWAFAYKNLTSVTLPEGLLHIQSDAFEGNQISEIVIPNTVLTIGSWAFAENQLTSLVIPSGLTEISWNAFSSNNLTSITIEGDENRFNEMWESIGFPTMLRPGIILFEGFAFDKDRNIILAYDESYGLDIVIPETIEGYAVLSIGSQTFQNKGLTSVVLPEGLEHIENDAFSYNQLTSIVIPSSVTVINSSVFRNNQLTSVTLPNTVIEIGNRAFYNNQLAEIIIPSSVYIIQWSAFEHNQLTSIIIMGDENRFNNYWDSIGFPLILKPSMIQYEGFLFDSDYGIILAYDESYGLDVIIPETIEGYSVLYIGSYAFEYKGLTSVIFPEGLERIEHYAFQGNEISSIIIPSSVVYIGWYAFSWNILTSITIEGDENRFNDDWESYGFPLILKPTIIHYEGLAFHSENGSILAYDESYGLDVIIPQYIEGHEVRAISNHAFAHKGLTSVILPEGLIDIGSYAFTSNQITSIIVPGSVAYIGWYAFSWNNLTSITIEGDENRFNDMWESISFPIILKPSIIQYEGLIFDSYTQKIITYDISYGLDVIIPQSIEGHDVLSISSYAFEHKGLTSVILPEGLQVIGAGAFRNNNITSINIPNSVIEIQSSAFAYNQLSSLTLSTNLTAIYWNTFYSNQLTHVTIPSSIVNIGYDAFGLNAFTSVTIEGDENRFNAIWNNTGFPAILSPAIIHYEGFAFNHLNQTIISYDHNYGLDVVIPSMIEGHEVLSIGSQAFDNKGLKSVVLPEGIQNIWSQAFGDNELTSITIPSSVVIIEWHAFAWNNLTNIIIEGDENRFNNDWLSIGFPINLKPTIVYFEGFTFDKHLQSIISYDHTYGLDVVIPQMIDGYHVISIMEHAFIEKGLTSVFFPEGLERIENYAFLGNEISSIIIPSSVTYIGWYAFSWNNLTSITIEGDENRFNDMWNDIGFSPTLKPTVIQYEGFIFDLHKGVVLSYDESYGLDVFIPNMIEGHEVLSIGSQAFRNKGITSISLPEGVLKIEQNAFENNELTSILIPSSVINVGWNAFASNPLIEIIIEGDQNRFNNIWTTIGLPIILKPTIIYYEGFFFDTAVNAIVSYDASYGLAVIIPETLGGYEVVAIGSNAFYQKALISVVLPQYIQVIGASAFRNNDLTAIDLPNGLITIGDLSFAENKIEEIIIPSTVTGIHWNAFWRNNLTSVTIEGDENRFNDRWNSIGFPPLLKPTIIYYEGFIFDTHLNRIVAYDESYGLDVLIPETINGYEVLSIGSQAFSSKGLTSVALSEGLQYIMVAAFMYNELSTLIIPSTVIHIESLAFEMNKLTEIIIPSNVSYIGSYAFGWNPLTKITIEGDENRFNDYWIDYGFPIALKPTIIYYEGFGFDYDEQSIISYDESYGLDVVIPQTIGGYEVLSIGQYAFNEKGLTSITLPEGLMFIRYGAFSNNELTSVVIPNTVIEVEGWSFENNQLTSIVISNGLDVIGSATFRNNQLTSVVIPNHIKSIDSLAFSDNLIEEIIIPSSVIEISWNAFRWNNITSIMIEGDENRFNHLWESIGFPILLKPTIIYYEGFTFDCHDGTIIAYDESYGLDVVIPEDIDGYEVITIRFDAFRNKGLTSVVLPDGLETIGYQAFLNNNLTTIVIPSNVTYIDWWAFSSNAFTSITIEGDEARFNDVWTFIGFPLSLKP
jgi:hypothetical protein